MRFVLKELNSNERYDSYIELRNQIGFCPACGEQVHNCVGNIKKPYFSHYKGTECTCRDNWDMSEWHKAWQDMFPEDMQEFYLKRNGIIHRADICYDDVVIEFQHSPISLEKFNERTNFWIGNNYKIIWVFDMLGDKSTYYSGNRHGSECQSRQFQILKHIDFKQNNLYIFFNMNLLFKDRLVAVERYNAYTNCYDIKGNINQWHEADEFYPDGIWETEGYSRNEFLELINVV